MSTSLSLEERLGPPRIDAMSLGMMSIGGFIAGILGGLLVFLFSYLILGVNSFSAGASPLLLSIIALITIFIANSILIYFYHLVFPERYTKSRTVFTQVAIYSIILYILFTPAYMSVSSELVGHYMLAIFVFHVLINVLGVSIIIEVISNYRYVLLGIYGSFVGAIASGFLAAYIFVSFQDSTKALYTLIWSVAVVFTLTTFFKTLIEFLYHFYYRQTGTDIIGDVFHAIEEEEKTIEKQIADSLTKF